MKKIIPFRKAPFTAFEKEYLKKLITPHANVFRSKRTDSDFNRRKLALWREITQAYNDCSRCTEANTQQLKKLWLNMKAKARVKSSEHQRKHEDEPTIDDMSLENETIAMPTIQVLIPNDDPGDEVDSDINEYAWQLKRDQRKSTELIPKEEDAHIFDTDVIDQILSDDPTPSTNVVHAKSHIAKINALRIKMIEKDIQHRNEKYKIELENQNKINDLKYQMLLLEYEHKKIMFRFIEKEQEEKLRKANQ